MIPTFLLIVALVVSYIFLFLSSGRVQCPPVYSVLGSVSSITLHLAPLPWFNKVSGQLSCKFDGISREINLPSSYCPSNTLFNRVSAVRALVDRECWSQHIEERLKRFANVDDKGVVPFILESGLLSATKWSKSAERSWKFTFDSTHNLGQGSWLASDPSISLWVPIDVPGVPENVAVFATPPVAAAGVTNLTPPLTSEVIVLAVWFAGELVESATDPTRNLATLEYSIRIGDKPYRVIYGTNAHEATECRICLEAAKEASPLVMQHCGHSFHEDCINQWARTTGLKRCPICRDILPQIWD
jgi:hypothetical protein